MPAKRILLIDDEWDNLECVQEFLHDDFEVTAACGGAAGIECLFDEQFDAVVLDLTMPDVDGFEVMRVIRRIVPELPVILASALPNLDQLAESIGATDFIVKPFRFTVLHERLRSLTEAPVRARAPLAATSG